MKQETDIKTSQYLPLTKTTQIKQNTTWAKKYKSKMKHLDTIQSTTAPKHKISSYQQKSPTHMYSPFLWQIAKGQSPIIKRRWLRWLAKTLQIFSQGPKLIKHVHQKLTISRLNGHDSL